MVTGRSLSSKQPNYCPVTETWMCIPSLSLFLIDSLSLTHMCTAILFAGIKLLPKSDTMVWHGPETPVSISNVTLLDFLWKIGKVELKFTPSWCIINLAESIFSSEFFFFVRYGLVPQKNKCPLSLPKKIQFIWDCNWRLSLAVILGRCLVCTLGS